ncbi:TrkA C-terminal domain-containing protein [Lacrimispora sp.]|uniref:TrkA C-terminal domain-containing protein n=1 Tax=Lacrimispora sp. TaxID=2719234 RepID=UPI0034616481
MEKTSVAPVYSQVALDIALRISRGELKENTKIYGRSLMASEYGVSPETIRKAIKLLEDMDIVETKQNSGSLVVSAEHAVEYVRRFSQRNDIRTYQNQLDDLLSRHASLSREISDAAAAIVRVNEKFSKTTPFINYETPVPADSPILGYTLGELSFWQRTAATVIAIRRGDKIVLSPGPYASIQSGDIIVYIGDVKCVEAVSSFLEKGII